MNASALVTTSPYTPRLQTGRTLESSLGVVDPVQAELTYWRNDELLVLERALPGEVVAPLVAEAETARSRLVRKSVPGYKQSGSVSYFALREVAPRTVALYKSPAFIKFLSGIAGMDLHCCPEDDPHACALYRYDRPGDRVGFHYDTSWYRGARFTVLVGLVNDSSARLLCDLHARDRHRERRMLEVATDPGTVVFFNGDKLRHAISPLGANEVRTVLTLQYVTDPRLTGWRRVVSQLKDAVTYFGLEAFAPRAATR